MIEVCCYEESKLSQRFKERGGGAIRIFLPNHDFSKEETEKAILKVINQMKEEGYKVYMWTSLPCSPWCSWQRVNQADYTTMQKSLKKRGRKA